MSDFIAEQTSASQLKQAWNALKAEQPKLRIRNAAEKLGVSELELLLTNLGDTVIRLDNRHGDLLQTLQGVGEVMALSRNNQVVHEKHGIYTDFKVTGKGQMGICLGDIDLRVFFNRWYAAVAVIEANGDSLRRTIQFFDTSGTAVHKIYCTAKTDEQAWNNLIEQHKAASQSAEIELSPAPTPEYPNSGKISAEAVQAEWRELKDVHHFQAMLKRLGISRTEALTLVGKEFARPLDCAKAETALTLAQERQVPVMVFVGNRGIVQIHTGTLNKLLRTGPWFNVLDPGFNLHFNTEDIAKVWLVRRPTAEGIITSIEVYNGDDTLVLTLFGERKPGIPERDDWQQLVADLEA